MFTFVTITYNQENLIIEHLESIKYQIENHGNNHEFKYILSDDCSKDSTVNIVEEWIKMNSKLFKEVKILTSIENQGIVSNYLRGISEVDTTKYKVLAGDDVFYKNNILELIRDYDLVFTPTIHFSKNKIQDYNSTNHLLINKELFKMKRLNKIDNYMNAPGTFINIRISKDLGLRNFLAEYKWIEDLPTWYYLFNYKNEINIDIKKTPYVLYRNSEGISLNKENDKYDKFTKELNKMHKQFDLKAFKYPKYINPYRYYVKYLRLKLKYYDSRFNKEVIEGNKIKDKAISEAPAYLEYIQYKTYEFYKSIGKEELYDYE